MPVTTARRLIAFDPTYGWPQEVNSSDIVQLPKILLAASGTTGLDAQGLSITGLPAPVNPTDAATKQYTDAIAQGISAVPSVRALGSGNISTLNGAQTVDGVALKAGDRVLLTGQTNAVQNGVWIVQSGAWTRPTTPPDYISGSHAAGRFCFVEEGTTYAEQGWVCTTDVGPGDVVDTSPLAFVQFSGLGEITAGPGLTKSLNTISILLAANSGLQFTGAALDHLLQAYGSLTKNADGLGIKVANTTLSTDATGLKVLGVPSLFTINQAAVDANVTAANLNMLVDGGTSLADGLHQHKSVLSAQTVAQVHTNGPTALNIGDPVYWSSTGGVLARCDAVSSASAQCVGIAAAAIAASATGIIIKRGIAPGVLSNATPGGQVFLNVGGGLTQALPTIASSALFSMGYASSATDLDVQPSSIGRRAAS